MVFSLSNNLVFATTKAPGQTCDLTAGDTCDNSTTSGCPTCDCIPSSPGSPINQCLPSGTGGGSGGSTTDVFGKITPPPALQNLLQGDPTGAGGISKFLSNLIALIFSIATIVLIFMILWGAYDWLTSGGDKEKLENAKKKLINAFVGIMLFAIAFAVIRVLGQFTGFKFFS